MAPRLLWPVVMKGLLISIALCACEPRYFVRDVDQRAAHAGSSDPIVASDGAHLKPEALAGAKIEEGWSMKGRPYVRVTPHNRRMRIAWALLGVGAALVTGAAAVGASEARPCTGDEICWLGQMVAGSTLGGVGGALVVSGGGLWLASLDDAEVK